MPRPINLPVLYISYDVQYHSLKISLECKGATQKPFQTPPPPALYSAALPKIHEEAMGSELHVHTVVVDECAMALDSSK